MSMFQNRRTVFLFVCSIVLIQALYYITTLQIKKTVPNVITIATRLNTEQRNLNQSSDQANLTVKQTNTSTVKTNQYHS